ncbi:MAG TPA: ATP-binding protein [Acidimicrobiia bacterium]|nr:ATP-binding protein [Acidimicrobiia bacterium]
MDTETRAVAASRSQLAVARRWAGETLERFGRAELADDVRLVVTELLTNAISHATAPGWAMTVWVRLSSSERGVRVEVIDPFPERAPEVQRTTRGSGLQIVERVAASWGYELTADAKTVWAVVEPPTPR